MADIWDSVPYIDCGHPNDLVEDMDALNWIPDVIVAGLLVYVLNRLSNLSDRVSSLSGRVSKIEGLLEGYFMRRDPEEGNKT